MWYHRIDFGGGEVTPGINDSPKELGLLDSIGLPKDCKNLHALDIGCQDGFFSFELERRAAVRARAVSDAVAARSQALDYQYFS